MDPQVIMQLLKEAQEVIAMQADEIQALRTQIKKPEDGMQKKASVQNLSIIVGLREEDIPSFIKEANDEKEVRDFVSMIEKRAKYASIGSIAEISDYSQSENPNERLESSLSSIIGEN